MEGSSLLHPISVVTAKRWSLLCSAIQTRHLLHCKPWMHCNLWMFVRLFSTWYWCTDDLIRDVKSKMYGIPWYSYVIWVICIPCVTSLNYIYTHYNECFSSVQLAPVHLLASGCPRSLQRGPLAMRSRLYVCPLPVHCNVHCASTVNYPLTCIVLPPLYFIHQKIARSFQILAPGAHSQALFTTPPMLQLSQVWIPYWTKMMFANPLNYT